MLLSNFIIDQFATENCFRTFFLLIKLSTHIKYTLSILYLPYFLEKDPLNDPWSPLSYEKMVNQTRRQKSLKKCQCLPKSNGNSVCTPKILLRDVIMFLTFLGPPIHLFDDLQYCKSSKIAIFWPHPPTSLMT